MGTWEKEIEYYSSNTTSYDLSDISPKFSISYGASPTSKKVKSGKGKEKHTTEKHTTSDKDISEEEIIEADGYLKKLDSLSSKDKNQLALIAGLSLSNHPIDDMLTPVVLNKELGIGLPHFPVRNRTGKTSNTPFNISPSSCTKTIDHKDFFECIYKKNDVNMFERGRYINFSKTHGNVLLVYTNYKTFDSVLSDAFRIPMKDFKHGTELGYKPVDPAKYSDQYNILLIRIIDNHLTLPIYNKSNVDGISIEIVGYNLYRFRNKKDSNIFYYRYAVSNFLDNLIFIDGQEVNKKLNNPNEAFIENVKTNFLCSKPKKI